MQFGVYLEGTDDLARAPEPDGAKGSTPTLPHLLRRFNLSCKGTIKNYIADDTYWLINEHAVSTGVVQFECKWEEMKNRYMHASDATRTAAQGLVNDPKYEAWTRQRLLKLLDCKPCRTKRKTNHFVPGA